MSDNTKDRMMDRVQQAARQGDLRRTRQRAAEQQSAEYDGKRWVALLDIKADSRIQVRAGGLDQDTVDRYATIMFENQSYAPFPPIELYRAEGEEDLWLSAGFHRVAAVEQANRWLTEAGLEPIEGVDAYVRPGGWQAAYWNAITDNLKHGKQLTTADLKNALYRLMGYDQPVPEDGDAADMARMSNRQLASLLGVSHTTIRKWLEEFQRETESGGNQFPPEARQRVGKDGKTYNVAGVQAANQRRAEEQREKGKPEPPVDRMAAKLAELQDAVLAVVANQPPMTYREIEFAVSAHLGRIANPGLLTGTITQLTRDGRLRNVGGGRYALPEAAPVEPSDNRYQIDTGETADDWLESPAVKGPAPAEDIDEALRRGEPVHRHDEDLAEKLSTLLRVGEMVAGHLEMVLERTEPIPDWLLIKLNELQGLLYGREGRDADIYDPGLTQLLDDLYAKHLREKGQ